MTSLGYLNEVVQVLKVAVILSDTSPIVTNRLRSMHRIILADYTSVRRQLHVMPGIPQ